MSERKLKRYRGFFNLNVIEFSCTTRAESKKKAVADVMWNINLRTLDKIRGVRVYQIGEEPSHE